MQWNSHTRTRYWPIIFVVGWQDVPVRESMTSFRKNCYFQNIGSVSSLLDGQSSLAQTAASTGILPTPPPSVPIQQSALTTTTTPIPMDQDSVATQILNLLMAQTQQQQVQQPQPQQTLQPQGMLQWWLLCWNAVSRFSMMGEVFRWKLF